MIASKDGEPLSVRLDPDIRTWLDRRSEHERLSRDVLVNRGLARLREEDAAGRRQLEFEFPGGARPTEGPPPRFHFKFIDLFAGIGGFRLGLESVGGQCVFTSEWDKYAQRTYAHWHGDQPHGDINTIEPDEIPDHDILAAGFPCQPFSLAGVSKKNALGRPHGFDCDHQGNLFFRICDIVRAKRPPVLILENVKNLRSHDRGRTWAVIRDSLSLPEKDGGLDYEVHAGIVDAAGWVPQHRERIFIVCFAREYFGSCASGFTFPEPPPFRPGLLDILEKKVDPKYVLTDHLWQYLQDYAEKHRAKGNGFGFGLVDPRRNPDLVTRTLSARYHKDGSEILISRGPRRNPRRLTPVECARLMGFGGRVRTADDIIVSDTQAYRQFGNAVVPPVIAAIGGQTLRVMDGMLRSRSRNGCAIKGRVRPMSVRTG